MRIEELTLIQFGAVRQCTLDFGSFDQPSLCDGFENNLPIAEFLTYLLYGKIHADLQAQESFFHGKIKVYTEKGLHLCIERKTELSSDHAPIETLSLTDLTNDSPLFFENSVGEELFGIDEMLFEPLCTLGTKKQLPEHLLTMLPTLLEENASQEQKEHTLRRIEDASSSLLRPNGKGGAIYELQKKLSELERKIEDSEQAANRTRELEEELDRSENEKIRVNNELQTLLDLKSSYRNLTAIREYDRLHAIEDDLDRERQNYEDFLLAHRVGTFLPTEEYAKEVADLQETVTDTVRAFQEARAELDLFTKEEEDPKTLSLFDTAQKKYGGFDVVKSTALVLFRRAAHTAFFAYFALFAAAFFTVCTLVTATPNTDLSFACFLLTVCCAASSLVLLVGRRRFENALLILCREFGAKNRDDLLARLTFLEKEGERMLRHRENLATTKIKFENAKIACTDALAALNRTTEKWGRHIDPAHALSSFEAMIDEIRYFLKTKRDFLERIEEKEQRVSLARKTLSNQSEIAVRALVSPFKRENLQRLERENRISEIVKGISFYNRQIDLLSERIESLRTERAETAARIGSPLALCKERDILDARKNNLTSIYRSYLLCKKAIQEPNKTLKLHCELGSFSAYFALSSLLLQEKLPFVVAKSALKEQERAALLSLCREENRQLFFDMQAACEANLLFS